MIKFLKDGGKGMRSTERPSSSSNCPDTDSLTHTTYCSAWTNKSRHRPEICLHDKFLVLLIACSNNRLLPLSWQAVFLQLMTEIVLIRHRKRHFAARVRELLRHLDDPVQRVSEKQYWTSAIFLPLTFYYTQLTPSQFQNLFPMLKSTEPTTCDFINHEPHAILARVGSSARPSARPSIYQACLYPLAS